MCFFWLSFGEQGSQQARNYQINVHGKCYTSSRILQRKRWSGWWRGGSPAINFSSYIITPCQTFMTRLSARCPTIQYTALGPYYSLPDKTRDFHVDVAGECTYPQEKGSPTRSNCNRHNQQITSDPTGRRLHWWYRKESYHCESRSPRRNFEYQRVDK